MLGELGVPVQPLHSGMQQRARLKRLERFKSSANAVLVATDVAGRGLDIQDVMLVVHHQVPGMHTRNTQHAACSMLYVACNM